MRPSELVTFLCAAIPARRPILITGAPGIGKTDIVDEACRRSGAALILSHPAVADPTDVKGLPWLGGDGTSATFLPFGELAQAIKATTPTVWFLDDLGQAPPSVQASFMQLLLARRVNGHALPDCVTFVAATNRRTDRAGVSGILEPVKSRFASIVNLDVNLDDWCAWAIDHALPAELIAFLRFRSDLLCKFEATADLTNSPVPRTWAHVAQLLALKMDDALTHAAVVGAVGEGAAVEFSAFRRLFAEMPNIDAILADPDKGTIPAAPATRYAVVTALAMRADLKNIAKVTRYAERLVGADAGEFAALLMRDVIRRDKSIMQTKAFVTLASGTFGDLITAGRGNR